MPTAHGPPHRRKRCCALASFAVSATRLVVDRSASFPKIEQRDAEFASFVRKIVGNARSWEYDDPDRQDVEELVIALEWRGFGVAGAGWFVSDLYDVASVGTTGREAIRPPWGGGVPTQTCWGVVAGTRQR